jgi:hypothetical protein
MGRLIVAAALVNIGLGLYLPAISVPGVVRHRDVIDLA